MLKDVTYSNPRLFSPPECIWSNHVCVGAKSDSFATAWTVARQAPLSGIFQAEYWSGLPFLPPRDLPNPGMEPTFLMSCALADSFFTARATWEATVRWWQGKSFYFLLPVVKGLCNSDCF